MKYLGKLLFGFMLTVFCSNSLYAQQTEMVQINAKELLKLHYNLGVALSYNNDYSKAIEQFDKVLNLDDSNADTHYNLGCLFYFHKKNLLKAHEHFQRYLELDPDATDLNEVARYIGEIEVSLWLDELNNS